MSVKYTNASGNMVVNTPYLQKPPKENVNNQTKPVKNIQSASFKSTS